MGSATILNARAANGSLVVGLALELLVALQVHALDGRQVEGRRQVVDDRVEQGLHALVLERRAGEHRHDVVVDRGVAERLAEVVGGDLLVAEVLLEDVVVVVRQTRR